MSIIYNLVGLPTLGWGYSFIMVTKHLSHGGDVINPVESGLVHQTSTLRIFDVIVLCMCVQRSRALDTMCSSLQAISNVHVQLYNNNIR